MNNVHKTVLYCLFGFLLLLCFFIMFKMFNISTKLRTISSFLDGEVFSARFHNVITNYFNHTHNLDKLLDLILPVVYAHTNVVYAVPIVEGKTEDIVKVETSDPAITRSLPDSAEEDGDFVLDHILI